MRIIVATFTYAPNVDGVAEAARQMVANFRSAGHEVRVVTGPVEGSPGPAPGDADGVTRFAISGAPAVGIGFKGEIEAYRAFLVSFDADVIVFHGWDTWPFEMALPVLPALAARTVLLSHGYAAHAIEHPRKLPRGLKRWLRWLPHVILLPAQLRALDRVVFLSEKTDWGRFFDAKVAHLTGAGTTMVIPNSTEVQSPADDGAFRRRHGIGEGIFFLNVANYGTRKNQMMALDAFCRAGVPGSTLAFIGSELGEYGAGLLASWEARKADHPGLRVLLLEKIPRSEVAEAFADCDVFLLSATAETQPIVLLEAMAFAKPFISTDVGCVSELKGGVVVDSVESMSARIKEFAGDTDLRESLGIQARADYEAHYNPKVTNAAWRQLIEDLAGREN